MATSETSLIPGILQESMDGHVKSSSNRFQLEQEGLSRGGQQQWNRYMIQITHGWTVGLSDGCSAPKCKLGHAQQC